MESDEPQLLSVAQTAQLLGVPESEVRRQIAAKSLPVVLVDQRMMVLAPALRRWVVAQGEEHRARSQRGPDYLGWDEPAEATGEPCPNCGAPLVPAPEYRSGRHGAVAPRPTDAGDRPGAQPRGRDPAPHVNRPTDRVTTVGGDEGNRLHPSRVSRIGMTAARKNGYRSSTRGPRR